MLSAIRLIVIMLIFIMLIVIMLIFIMLIFIMLIVIMLIVIMLSVIVLIVFMLIVVAPTVAYAGVRKTFFVVVRHREWSQHIVRSISNSILKSWKLKNSCKLGPPFREQTHTSWIYIWN